MTYDDVVAALESLADEKLRAFNARIMYTRMRVYGVRTPDLRRLAARVKRECPDFAEGYFARQDPSHEELLICGMQTGKDAERNARLLERLIPRMDCWAHTDMVIDGMKWVKDAHAFLRRFDGLKAGGEFEKRAFVVMLMQLLARRNDFAPISSELDSLPLGEYYVDMAVAWLISEVVARDYAEGVRLLLSPRLTHDVRLKALSKCRDSFRVPAERKAELKTLVTRAAP